MLFYLIAAALMVTPPIVAECNCSPEKIEALRAKLRAEGASEDKVKGVNCDDVCEAEKPLANAEQGEEGKEGSEIAAESEEGQSSTGTEVAFENEEGQSTSADDALLATCNCGGKKGKGNS